MGSGRIVVDNKMLTDLAARVAKNLCPRKDKLVPENPFKVSMEYFLDNLRSASRIGRELEEAGIVVRYWSEKTRSWHGSPYSFNYHDKSVTKHYVEVSKGWFEKNGPTYAVMPKFKFKEINKGSAPRVQDHYRDPYDWYFENSGFLYYYFHKDEFDCREVTEKHHGAKYRRDMIFPKKDLPRLYDHVMRVKYEAFIKDYPDWCLENLFGMKDAYSELAAYMGESLTHEFEEWTPGSLRERIEKEKRALEATQLRLSILEGMTSKVSADTSIIDKAIKLLGEYVEKNFPLYLADFKGSEESKILNPQKFRREELDLRLSKICKWYYSLASVGSFEDAET